MRSTFTILAVMLAGPAMAGETIIDGSSYRPNFRYEFSLAQCQAKVAGLNDLMLQLQAKVTPAPVVPVAKPAPAKRKKQLRCKKGRTRNAAGICGRWS